jgi:hypothetical protein
VVVEEGEEGAWEVHLFLEEEEEVVFVGVGFLLGVWCGYWVRMDEVLLKAGMEAV